MALAGVVATQLTTPETRTISVFIGSRDFTSHVKWDTLVATDNGTSGRGTTNLHLERTMAQAPEVYNRALLRVVDHTNDAEAVRGVVLSRKPLKLPGYSALDIIAADIGSLLDETFIPSEVRPAETMRARIGYLWGAHAGSFLSGDLSNVASIGGTLPAQNFAGVTLRQAIEATISQASASADYYVDALGKLHVFTAESNDAPLDIDADSPGAGEVAPETLDIDYDSGVYANRVYIQGATPSGSGFFTDHAAVSAANGLVVTRVMRAPDCETAAMALSLANMYLGRVSSGTPRGSFSLTGNHGWRAGQNLTITSADHGLTDEPFRIARVTTRIARPGSSLLRHFSVEFGGSRAGGTGVSADSLGTGQLVSGQMGGASNVYVTSDGVSVTDGSVVRAQIGKLPNGSYGVRIVASDGSVLIDGEQITLTGSTGTISGSQLSGGTIPSGVALGIAQTTITADGVEVNDGSVDRVTLGALGGGDYGLKVVNSGSTVIIDGTSNMFKILATGTHSVALGVGPNVSGGDAVTLTGLGTLSTTPAHLTFLATGNTTNANQHLGFLQTTFGQKWVAGSSGGSPNQSRQLADHVGDAHTALNGSGYVVHQVSGKNDSGVVSVTFYARYYILKEAAL